MQLQHVVLTPFRNQAVDHTNSSACQIPNDTDNDLLQLESSCSPLCCPLCGLCKCTPSGLARVHLVIKVTRSKPPVNSARRHGQSLTCCWGGACGAGAAWSPPVRARQSRVSTSTSSAAACSQQCIVHKCVVARQVRAT